MLKAEAVDIKDHAVLFNFVINDDVRRLFDLGVSEKVRCVEDELNTEYHQQIDDIVFNYFELNDEQRRYVLISLRNRISERNNKPKKCNNKLRACSSKPKK
ncbi:MAG: hypothetical protein IJ165_05740 [Proteobacteria bacterium]|nr:hypothetical protein [Pseudomonadota bacterium]